MPDVPNRLSEPLAAVPAGGAQTYSHKAKGPTRRAALRDSADGPILGYVWSDGREAAGWLDATPRRPETSRAAAFVWRVHRHLFEQGRPAAEVLNPEHYTPMYHLDPPAEPSSGRARRPRA